MGSHKDGPESSARLEAGLLEALDQARATLLAEDVRLHFSASLQWLDERHALWTSRNWRIGLIGITSSGKSTLLNALLDDRLLPARVRPSSNTLVICFRGETTSAVVHYEDGRQERHEQDLTGVLSRLADETTNRGNRLGVKEIELSAPSFRLGQGVELVDTPGLDAKGYDEHERLTLKTLLPTVDLVVFLTTAKPSSDALVRGYLDVIGEAEKPAIVVQNMIDSIEPKLGRLGVEAKSKRVVAEEYRQRLQRLLQRCASPVARKALVLQVSAQWALEGRQEDSQLPLLVKEVTNQLQLLAPRLAEGRRRQLLQHLRDLVQAERAASGTAVKHWRPSPESTLERWRGSLQEAVEKHSNALVRVKVGATAKAREFVGTASQLGYKDIEAAEQLKKAVDRWTRDLPSTVSRLLDQLSATLRSLAAELNLSAEDFEIPPPRGAPRLSLEIETKLRSETTWNPQRGLWASFKRLFGSESYEETKTQVTTLKLGEFRKRVAAITEDERRWIGSTVATLQAAVAGQAERIDHELHRRERELEVQRASQVQGKLRLAAVERLAVVIAQLDQLEGQSALPDLLAPGPSVFSEDKERVVVPVAVQRLLQLTAVASRCRHTALRSACLSRAAKYGASQRVLIWGGDLGYVTRFLELFWSDLGSIPSPRADALTRWDGPAGVSTLGIAVEEDPSQGGELRAELTTFLAEPATLFLLADPHQVGSTDSQLHRSVLRHQVAHLGPTVVVAQALRSLLHSTEALAEGILDLRRMVIAFGLQPVAFLANDDSSSLTALLDALWFGPSLRTQRDEERVLGKLCSPWFRPPLAAAEVIRHWRQLTREGLNNG